MEAAEGMEAVNTRMTYEEACNLQESLWSPERVRAAIATGEAGLAALRVENRAKLWEAGWTSEALCEEGRRRMHARIAELKEQEGRERAG
jgi:hypothetical protein